MQNPRGGVDPFHNSITKMPSTQDATFPHAAVFKPQPSKCRYPHACPLSDRRYKLDLYFGRLSLGSQLAIPRVLTKCECILHLVSPPRSCALKCTLYIHVLHTHSPTEDTQIHFLPYINLPRAKMENIPLASLSLTHVHYVLLPPRRTIKLSIKSLTVLGQYRTPTTRSPTYALYSPLCPKPYASSTQR